MYYYKKAPLIIAALIFCVFSSTAYSFHDKGVANCDGCHISHNSQDGLPPNIDSPYGNDALLKYDKASDVCLSCHADSLGAVLGSDPLNPPPELGGGNFVYLLEDNINDQTKGATSPISGHVSGHNIISDLYGITEDPINMTAPGAFYPANRLECTSCHDPHGNGNYRMLYGAGEINKGGFVYIFTNPAPTAEGLDLSSGPESKTNHTAYQSGWSGWCANCHGYYHSSGVQLFEHPTDEIIEFESALSYDEYDGPTNPNGGTNATSFIPELPFEEVTMTTNSTVGPTKSSKLSCMTCHRAHATSAPKALRWDGNVVFLNDDGLESGSYPIPNPYNHPDQRALCVKCHYGDASNHGFGQACMFCHRTDPGN